MVRSGRNPLAQLVKRLSESHATKIPEAMCASEISTKKPNNVYILDDRSCCEILEKTNQFDVEGNLLYRCRVYECVNPLFEHPCDSRIVKIYKGSNHLTKMELVPSINFLEKGIMLQSGSRETVIFMAILHTV